MTEPPRSPGVPPGLLFVVAGLIAVAIGVALPMGIPEDPAFTLSGNTLLADFGDGWIFLCGVLAVAVCLWCWWRLGASWLWIALPGVVGLLAAGVEAAAVAADEVWADEHGLPLATRPGAGIWTVAIGSLLVAVGGSALRGAERPARAPASPSPGDGASAGDRAPAGDRASPARDRPAAGRSAPPPTVRPRSRDDDTPAPPLWRRPENDPPLDDR